MNELATKLTSVFTKTRQITDSQRDIYEYGFKLLLADIINFGIVLILSMMLGRLLIGVMFLLTLCSIRKYSGGFHAKTFWLCRLSLILTFLCVVVLNNIIYNLQNANIVVAFISILSLLMISVLAPVLNPKKTLSQKQIRNNKRKATIIAALFSTISIILFDYFTIISITISVTLLAIVILMIIGLLVAKGGKKNV